MRRLAKILVAGTVLAIQTSPALNPAAISQSTVNNNQVQLGDVFSTQTLNVVDVSGSTTATTSASGNTVSSAVVSGSLNVQSSQTMSGNANAQTTVNVATNAGAQVTMNTSALGNGSDVGSFEGGPVTGAISQTTGPVQILATSNFNGQTAQTGGADPTSVASFNVQAMANSHGVTVSDTSSNTTTTQTSNAQTEADGGAVLQYTPGTAAASATGVSNNLTGAGSGNASQTLVATQTMNGPLTQATQSINLGNGQTIQSNATASANNIYVSNENGPVAVTDSQTNTGFTFAQSVATGFEFGSGQASSDAVANSVLVGNAGEQMSLDNTQSNNSGVQSNASFSGGNTGNPSYDAGASATAMGNAATGFACSDCNGVVTVSNNQMNSGGVSAASTIDVAGPNRSVNASATAVGNNATFYVSKPSH